MIKEYYRPESIEEALALLGRETPMTRPLAGGTELNSPSEDLFDVVDLQSLGLNTIEVKGSNIKIGAMVTLQNLLDTAGLPSALSDAIRHEATYNLRQSATVAGTLVSASGRSAFATAILALDAQLVLMPNEEKIALGELLPLRSEMLKGKIITEITIPGNTKLAYQYVSRSPADLPIVCVAIAKWSSGRTRVVLGGHGAAPIMVVDGKDENDILSPVGHAYMQAEDEWASAEYRVDVVKTLTKRCLEQIK